MFRNDVKDEILERKTVHQWRYYKQKCYFQYTIVLHQNIETKVCVTLSKLIKSEYQILYNFYDINQPQTKHDPLEKIPSLNKNTSPVVIKNWWVITTWNS